ncbi:MAG: hypothetical protein ACYTG0_08975 [Planctomycetota bacterium]|jgi:hypothetical protein
MFRNLIALAAAAVLFSAVPPEVRAAEADISVTVLEDWSNVFGGRRAEFHCAVTSRASFRGRAGWSLAVGRRTIVRGETSVAAGPQKTGSIEIQFDVPAVKQGVVMSAVLSVACYAPGASEPAASLEKTLWIFPEDPFANRSQWLKQSRIRLFDPVGKTRQVFQQAGIPFSQTHNVDSLSSLNEGLLVIGEGTSLEEYRGLSQIMVKTAAKGVPVLCLAPSNGQFDVPGTEGADLPRPTRLVLRSSDVIRELDKRLDARAWPPEGKVAAGGLVVISDRGHVIARVVEGELGWPWLEAGFSAKRGKLIVCGFGLVKKWDAGPTPRFLLARLLEYMTFDRSTSISKGEVR